MSSCQLSEFKSHRIQLRKDQVQQSISSLEQQSGMEKMILASRRKSEHTDIEDANDILMEKRLVRAENAYSDNDEGSDILAFDGMETIVLTQWMKKARVMIQSSMTTGRIDKNDLDHLKGVIRFCASTIKKDLGPGSQNYLKERYKFMQTDLASLRWSFTKMRHSTEVVET